MKRLICGLFIAGCAACFANMHRLPVLPDKFKITANLKYLDIYKTGRYDFDGDCIPEQIVIESGGGRGGPLWHIRRLNGELLSDDMFGYAWLGKKKNNFPIIIVEHKNGTERSFTTYEFNGKKYENSCGTIANTKK